MNRIELCALKIEGTLVKQEDEAMTLGDFLASLKNREMVAPQVGKRIKIWLLKEPVADAEYFQETAIEKAFIAEEIKNLEMAKNKSTEMRGQFVLLGNNQNEKKSTEDVAIPTSKNKSTFSVSEKKILESIDEDDSGFGLDLVDIVGHLKFERKRETI